MKLLAIEVGQFGDYYKSRYKQVEKYGIDLYVLSGIAEKDHWHSGRFFISNSMNISDLTILAEQLHREHKFDGVFTFAENSVIATAIIANALQLPGISVDAAVKSRNKIAMRDAHREGQAPHPEYCLAPSLPEALDAAGTIGYPVILKPTLGSTSQFVFRVNNEQEMAKVFPIALAGINEMIQFKNEGITEVMGLNSLLVESYLDGREFLIEAYTWDGETVLGSIVDRVTLEGNSFDDDVHHAPTDLTGIDLERVHAVVHAGAVAQGLTRSVLHAEIRFHQGMPYIVEIAARPGGGGLDFMARISSSYCPIKAILDIAAGIKPGYQHYLPTGKHTFALCLISDPGLIDSITIPDEITQDPDVFMLKITSAVGRTIKRPPEGNDIIGFLGAMGNSREEAEQKVMNYSNRIVVKTL